MYFFYYVPVGVDVTARRTPVMTTFFTVACVAVFVLNKYFRDAFPVDFYQFIYYPGYSPWAIAAAAAFLHFGYVHLLGNLLYLVLFGRYLEDRLGPIVFTAVYLGAAVVGNMLQAYFNIHVLKINVGIIGASGAVSGLLGAFLVRLYRSRVRVAYWVFAPLLAYTKAGRADVPLVVAMGFWFLMQSVRSLLQFEGASANVAHVTHIAGFIFGAVLTILVGGLQRGREEALLINARRYVSRGDYYAARGELGKYTELRPYDGDARAELARVMVQSGDGGEKAQYQRACELLLKYGQRGRAESVFEEALRGSPEFVLPAKQQLDLAFGLERNLKFGAALAAYRNFAGRYPDHPEAPFALLREANLHLDSFGNRDTARRCYKVLIEEYPSDAWVDYAREQVRRLA